MLNNTAQCRLVVVGNGMAATRFVKLLVAQSHDYAITVINAEPVVGYNRIMLSPLLAGEKTFADIVLQDESWYAQQHITVLSGTQVTEVATASQHVRLSDGQSLPYDKLVFATGSKPFIIPLPNHQAKGVCAFRTKADVEQMLDHIKQDERKQCIVIGAGLLGLEAANALNKQGAQVTVVHHSPNILDRQLNPIAAGILQRHFAREGIRFCLNAQSDIIRVTPCPNGGDRVAGLQLKDGTVLDASLIVMTVGVRPNIAVAKASGVPCDKGILVNAHMQTETTNVYAIGECVQFEQTTFGLVAPVYDQAAVLVATLLGQNSTFKVAPTATKLKVSGVDLFSAGDISEQPHYQYIEYHDPANHIYKRISLHNNNVVGSVMYGDVADGAWMFDLIGQQSDVSNIRQQLMFGAHFCQ